MSRGSQDDAYDSAHSLVSGGRGHRTAKKSASAEHRDTVAVLLDHEATLKRLHYDGDRVWLAPDNPAFKPILPRTNARLCSGSSRRRR